MREKNLEQKFVDAVRTAGGLAPKFVSPGFDGMPDRIVLFPGGRMAFVEVKAPGKKPRALQLSRHTMLRKDHLKMPEIIYSECRVFMDADEQEIYDHMCHDLTVNLGTAEVTAANAGVLSGKLLQMANGAVYTDTGGIELIHDRKLDALEDIIESMNGRPLLVTYWYRHDLSRIESRLRFRKIDYGKLDSDESIAKWNRGEIPVALMHPASAGHGLNLQSGGSTICWFGLTWRLELYQQAIARIYRQGQTSQTVVVQHIITDGTIDEDVMRALSRKERTQSALINAVKYRVKHCI